MKEETSIQNSIKIALSKKGCIVHRANVGEFFTLDGRRVHLGLEGHSDLYGHRSDGQAFYIEVKTARGTPSEKQKTFLMAMKNSGARAGIARNADDALKIVFSEVKGESQK